MRVEKINIFCLPLEISYDIKTVSILVTINPSKFEYFLEEIGKYIGDTFQSK
jgi:hypothetical protein